MKISSQFMKSIFGIFGMLLLLAPLTVLAQTKVVVIPLYGDDPKPLKNIITVAKANGNFTDPVAAVNSIKDASSSNPYLVVIGPGVYTITQTLQMKEYVDIVGSGQNVTRLTGAISTDSDNASSAIISGASNSALSSLTVENTGGSAYSIALYNGTASPMVTDVTAKASGGTDGNYGVENYVSSSPTMTGVTVWAIGGSITCGVINSYGSDPIMGNVSATASGGTFNYGISNDNSSPTMANVTATASGGTKSYGIYIVYSGPTIRRSTIDGGIYLDYGSSAKLSQSTLKGGVYIGLEGTNTCTCVACDNGSGGPLNPSCQ